MIDFDNPKKENLVFNLDNSESRILSSIDNKINEVVKKLSNIGDTPLDNANSQHNLDIAKLEERVKTLNEIKRVLLSTKLPSNLEIAIDDIFDTKNLCLDGFILSTEERVHLYNMLKSMCITIKLNRKRV